MKTNCLWIICLLVAIRALAGISVAPPNGGSNINTNNLVAIPNTLGFLQVTSPSNVISNPNVVTNQPVWLLFTNNIAYGNGKWYSFPSSSSAGALEVQALNPPLLTNGYSGVIIQLAQPGQYICTGPFSLTNSTTIIGYADFSAGFVFQVPTNIFTLSNVMATVIRNDSQADITTNLFKVGLVQLGTIAGPGPAVAGMSQGSGLPSFEFRNVYFKVATNFPCVIMAGTANSVNMQHVGFFGPDILTTNGVVPNWPVGTFSTAQTTIGCDLNVFALFTVKDSVFDELGVGLINPGNSYLDVDSTGFYQIAAYGTNGSSVYTNGYPQTNWLSVGPAIYSGNAAYTALINNSYPYGNKLDIWGDGIVRIGTYEPQGSLYHLAIGNGGGIFHADGTSALIDKAVLFTNSLFQIVPLPIPSVVNGWQNFIYDSTFGTGTPDGYAWEQRINGNFAWGWTDGDPNGQVFAKPNGFYFDGAAPLYGNASGLTNGFQNTPKYTNFLFAPTTYTNTTTRSALVSVNGQCTPTTTVSARFAIATSQTGATFTTNAAVGLDADAIFTTAPHSWYQTTAIVPPGGIWQVIDITGGGAVMITNSYWQTLQ